MLSSLLAAVLPTLVTTLLGHVASHATTGLFTKPKPQPLPEDQLNAWLDSVTKPQKQP